MNSLNRFTDPVYCLMRLIVGLLLAQHGGQLVLGMFGGMPGSEDFQSQLGGWIMLVGGFMIAFGFFTRLAASPWTSRSDTGHWRITRTETWAAFAPGTAPPIRYAYTIRAPGSRDQRGEMATAPITVPSVLVPGSAPPSPAPLRPPVTRPYVAWQLLAALILGAAVAFLFIVLLRGRRVPTRVRTADEIFDDELDLLEVGLSKSVPEESFYDWLAEITRWYLEQKVGFPAPRLTSSEIVARARDRTSEPVADDLDVVFSICDGYRFARREHRRQQALAAIAAAREAAAAIREEGARAASRESA